MNLKIYRPLPNRSLLPVLFDVVAGWIARTRDRLAQQRALRQKRCEYINMLNMPDHMLYDIGLSRDQIKDAYYDTFRNPDYH